MSEVESASFWKEEYCCYRHLKHCDEKSYLVIDLGESQRGNFGACMADLNMGYIRLLNHGDDLLSGGKEGSNAVDDKGYSNDASNVQLKIGPGWQPDWYEPLGEGRYEEWYQCSLVVKATAIDAGEELLMSYKIPPRRRRKNKRGRGGVSDANAKRKSVEIRKAAR